ncbi:tectonic-2 [Biomphalaria pfeifferi]|uniref:Tectonic-2 n=1 Tax=Biomphalaria pfeifferi TaxID=112525 RepID=A0AAD8FLS2_BIOPF|nr:tectonic-2 [Biomphalaria pfeifferi]
MPLDLVYTLLYLCIYILQIASAQQGTSQNISCRSNLSPAIVQAVTFKPARATTYRTSFTSIISLSVPVARLDFSCHATIAATLQEAESALQNPNCNFTSSTTTSTTTTTTTTTTPTTTTATPTTTSNDTSGNLTTAASTGTTTTGATTSPTAPPDPTSRWLTNNVTIPISPFSSGLYTNVTTYREKAPIDIRMEIVVTTCCASANSDPLLRNLKAASYIVAHMAPYVCSGCTSENVTDPTEERIFQNPGYVEVAPCPCDLTQYSCDINCCCDTECSTVQKARFSSCLAGLPGGMAPDVEDYKCSTNAFNPTDWHLVTCVYWENNGYLGMYYQNRKKLKSSEEISAEVKQLKGTFSLRENEKRYQDALRSSYTYGTIIKTFRQDNTAGTLSLPQTVPGGACNPLIPVQFLVDTISTCATKVTDSICNDLSVLSSKVYANGCSESMKISSSGTSNTQAITEVRYYCATDIKDYLANVQTGTSSSKETDITHLARLNCTDACSEQACWEYNVNKTYQSTAQLPARCSWDDGASVLGPNGNGICNNAVLEVRYNFEWSGTTISKVTADIVLANVTAGTQVVQKFSSTWQAKTNSGVLKSDNYLNTTSAYQRSGTAGYNFGKPLSSGCLSGNSTSVDTVVHKQMSVFLPGADGLCENAQRKPLTFGDELMSACALKLSFSTLNNACDNLRTYISNQLNVLMAANRIGRYGYNDPSNSSMWIPVIRQSLENTTDQLMTTAAPVNGTFSNTTTANVTEPLRSWANNISGVCFVPTGIHLHIMYAQTGVVNDFPRYEVTGAYIGYSQSNWTLNCAGANSAACTVNSSVQSFYLTSTVRYIRIPADPKPSQSKFYASCDPDNFGSDTCERFFTTFNQGECYYDTCWQELAYPVTSLYQGESRMYTLPFFLVFVLGVIGYVSVARPGWS